MRGDEAFSGTYAGFRRRRYKVEDKIVLCASVSVSLLSVVCCLCVCVTVSMCVGVAVSVGLPRPATIRGVIRGPSGLVAGRDIQTLATHGKEAAQAQAVSVSLQLSKQTKHMLS